VTIHVLLSFKIWLLLRPILLDWLGCGDHHLARTSPPSDIEPDVENIAVLHDIVPPLEAQSSLLARSIERASGDQTVVADHLDTDEATC